MTFRNNTEKELFELLAKTAPVSPSGGGLAAALRNRRYSPPTANQWEQPSSMSSQFLEEASSAQGMGGEGETSLTSMENKLRLRLNESYISEFEKLAESEILLDDSALSRLEATRGCILLYEEMRNAELQARPAQGEAVMARVR